MMRASRHTRQKSDGARWAGTRSVRRVRVARALLGIMLAVVPRVAAAHPLGNFTINHFVRLVVGTDQVGVRLIVDMAEIPTFQELQVIDGDGDGTASPPEINAYLDRAMPEYTAGLVVTVDGDRVPLAWTARTMSLPVAAGGLKTLRIEADFIGRFPASAVTAVQQLHFQDTTHGDRLGWHELVVVPAAGAALFNSSAFGNAVTDELKAYPTDLLTAPLDERTADLSVAAGVPPAGTMPLRFRDGRVTTPAARDRLAELITIPTLTPAMTLLALLIAALLGGLHALSPGHGKTVVGAYLVGSRGTARHAAFLGLTVTITHTLGVFTLGLLTLFASRYVVPERVFPVLSLVSGGIVLTMGIGLFVSRLRGVFVGPADHDHAHDHHQHEQVHDHGRGRHTHLPPGADGAPITWRSLLTLGISGGIVPCPSALVVLLSAVALHRIGFGLLLIVAFSAGLASMLTAVGLAFVYAQQWVKRSGRSDRLVRVLPVMSALVITCAGAAICHQALAQAGVDLIRTGWLSSASVLGLGLIFGLKHALEADHLAAISTIVSERKSVLSSSLVGALWGVGHTLSLLLAGVVVMLLHVEIGVRMALMLEFGVALMLIGLGANALRKVAGGARLHLHAHTHGGRAHLHPHLHDGCPEPVPHSHHGFRFRARPVVVGMVHGLAGSAALMLLVLSTISSRLLGFAYIGVFGVGSIGGMLFMSALVSLPVHLTAERFTGVNLVVRTIAAVFSLALGLMMAYQIGVGDGLFV